MGENCIFHTSNNVLPIFSRAVVMAGRKEKHGEGAERKEKVHDGGFTERKGVSLGCSCCH